jgi:fructose-1-phosphate kinase PfkB-like protein
MALDAIGELGARNVLIGHAAGAFALIREERRVQRFEARITPLVPVAHPGAGDAMLAGYLAARSADKPFEEALRLAVATGAAATLEVGGGRFDSREVSRLAANVTVSAVEPVSAR